MAARRTAKTTATPQRPHAQGRSRAEAVLKTGSLAPQPAASLSIAAAIGSQVRNLRHKLDLTGHELAEQAGLSASMLSKIENGAVSRLDQNPRSAVTGAQRAAHHLFFQV